MASIASDPNGRKRILFVGSDGQRRPIRLGKVTAKQAEAFKVRVEQLVSAAILGHPPDDETSRWLVSLDDVMHARLSAVGLTRPRHSLLLKDWLEKYATDRHDLKPASVVKVQQTAAKLLTFFDPRMPLRAMTPERAAEWRQWLANQRSVRGGKITNERLSEATVRKHCRHAKAIFNEAFRREIISHNPLRNLRSAAVASDNDHYVTPADAEKILGACPSLQWRLLFSLARFAGLRTPSETHLLTWADVDWARGRLTVCSAKTERHAGHEQRVVPVTPKLMAVLQEARRCRRGTAARRHPGPQQHRQGVYLHCEARRPGAVAGPVPDAPAFLRD